jgi:endonuclease-3
MLKADRIYSELEKLYPVVKCELDYKSLYELLIAVVLSAQTTDIAVNKVTPELFKKYPTVFDLATASIIEVHQYIKTLGLSNTKAKNIVNLSKKLVDETNGEVLADRESLMSLPGVGRKTANVVLVEGFRIPAMPVDTHIIRVSNRLTLTTSSNPLVIEQDLINHYEEIQFYNIHLRLIYFGRRICKAQTPLCEVCPLTDICKYYKEIVLPKITTINNKKTP